MLVPLKCGPTGDRSATGYYFCFQKIVNWLQILAWSVHTLWKGIVEKLTPKKAAWCIKIIVLLIVHNNTILFNQFELIELNTKHFI